MPVPKEIVRISDTVWEIPVSHKPGMRVPARIYATEKLLPAMDDGVFDQVTNVATLPGIVGYACCMPDGHWGYGFPIGGRRRHGPRHRGDLPRRHRLRHQLRHAAGADEPHRGGGAAAAPRAGRPALRAGPRRGGQPRASSSSRRSEFRRGRRAGARAGACRRATAGRRTWSAPRRAAASPGADASKVSDRAVERGCKQIGTLGSGNHYLEIQVARPENIFDRGAGQGLRDHDSRTRSSSCSTAAAAGFGHQVATDYLQSLPQGHGAEVRHQRPGPRAGLRALPLPRGAGLLRGHEVRASTCPSPTAR